MHELTVNTVSPLTYATLLRCVCWIIGSTRNMFWSISISVVTVRVSAAMKRSFIRQTETLLISQRGKFNQLFRTFTWRQLEDSYPGSVVSRLDSCFCLYRLQTVQNNWFWSNHPSPGTLQVAASGILNWSIEKMLNFTLHLCYGAFKGSALMLMYRSTYFSFWQLTVSEHWGVKHENASIQWQRCKWNEMKWNK